jgi:hypothetical protein
MTSSTLPTTSQQNIRTLAAVPVQLPRQAVRDADVQAVEMFLYAISASLDNDDPGPTPSLLNIWTAYGPTFETHRSGRQPLPDPTPVRFR